MEPTLRSLVAVLIVVSLSAAACGSDFGTSGDDSGGADEQTTDEQTTDEEITPPDEVPPPEEIDLDLPPIVAIANLEEFAARWPDPIRCDPVTADEAVFVPVGDRVAVSEEPPIDAPVNVEAIVGEESEFRVTVSGSDEGEVFAFFEEARFCAEAIPVDEPLGEPEIVPAPDAYLIAFAGVATGLEPAQLQEAVSALGEGASLADALDQEGVDPATVLADTTARMVADGVFASDPGLLEDFLGFRLFEEDAPLLFSEADDPLDDAQLLAELDEDPMTLVVTAEYIGDPEAENVVVGFAVDPTIGKWTRHYRAKCRTWARAWLATHIGRVRLVLFQRMPWQRHGIAAASAGQSTGYLYGFADRPTTFDVIVRGLRTNSSYTIYDYWYEGSGGGC